jgi:hypothetical protein
MDVLRHGWGVVTIHVGKGRLNKVEWLQSRFYWAGGMGEDGNTEW